MLLATRAEDEAADAEYAALCRFSGLAPAQLHRVRLESKPMPALDLAAYSGLIIGGSPFTASDAQNSKSGVQLRVEVELAELLNDVVDRDFPFLGACYGIGTLGRHQGAVIDGMYAEPIGAVTITLTDEGVADPLLASLPRSFSAFVGHKETCRTLAEGAVLLASSAGCPVQMFRSRKSLYATQFHPELDAAGLRQRISIYRHSGYFRPDDADAVLAGISRARVMVPHRILANFVRRYRT